MYGNYATSCTGSMRSPQDDMASTLSYLNETQTFQCADASAPETRGNLGKASLEHGNERPPVVHQRELLQVELGRVPQVGNRFFDSFSLTHCADLRAISDIKTIFFCATPR